MAQTSAQAGRLYLYLVIFSYLCITTSWNPYKECSEGPCMKGEYHDIKTDKCLPCILGKTYMDLTHHECKQCKLCTRLHLNEVTLQNCNLTADRIIGCIDNYYRNYDTCDKCIECKEGQVEKTPCGPDRDRVCYIPTTTSTTTTTTTTTTTKKPTTYITTTLASTTGEETNAESGLDETEWIAIGVGICVFVVMVGLFTVLRIYVYKKRNNGQNRNTAEEEQHQADSLL